MKDILSRSLAFVRQKPLLAVVGLFVLGAIGMLVMHQVEQIPEVACSPCHVMQPYVDGYHKDDLLAHSHEKAGVACIDCHDNGIEDKVMETVWYVTDDFDDPPLKRAFDNKMCVKCHKVDEIIAKTNYKDGNPHDSHLGDLVCSDCHYSHEKSQAACQKCHNFEFLQNLPPEWAGKGEKKAGKSL